MPAGRRKMRELLKKMTSTRTRRELAFAIVQARKPTARWRPLPNLLVIGGQRCGTSSLFKYLGGHPRCAASVRKEVRFFTEYYGRGASWYRSHFPLSTVAKIRRAKVFFEATPDYLLDPRVPKRASSLLPDFRVIVLLRDPVERAYSHYWHNRRLGTETLPFQEALAAESDRIGSHLARIERGSEEPTPKSLLRYAYVERGRYARHLERWLDFIESERVLILPSEFFYQDTDTAFQEILAFLGLPEWRPQTYRNFSYAEGRPAIPPMPEESRHWLEGELAPDVEKLHGIGLPNSGTVGWGSSTRT